MSVHNFNFVIDFYSMPTTCDVLALCNGIIALAAMIKQYT